MLYVVSTNSTGSRSLTWVTWYQNKEFQYILTTKISLWVSFLQECSKGVTIHGIGKILLDINSKILKCSSSHNFTTLKRWKFCMVKLMCGNISTNKASIEEFEG